MFGRVGLVVAAAAAVEEIAEVGADDDDAGGGLSCSSSEDVAVAEVGEVMESSGSGSESSEMCG